MQMSDALLADRTLSTTEKTSLWALPITAGARLTLQFLCEGHEQDLAAWDQGTLERPPFVSYTYEALQIALRRCRRQIAKDLKQLQTISVIRRARRDGQRGWELHGCGQVHKNVYPGALAWTRTTGEAQRPEVGRVVRARQGRYVAAVERMGNAEMHLVAPDGARRKSALGVNGRHITSGPYKLTEFLLRPPAEMTLLQALQQFVREVPDAGRKA